MDITITALMARSVRAHAMHHTLSNTIRTILNNMRFPSKAVVNLRFPHYWAQAYHDGYAGGIKKKGIWLFWPRKGGITRDPRRPPLAINERKKKDVLRLKSQLKGASKSTKKRFRQMVLETGGIFTKHRKGWKGDRFLDKAIKSFNANIPTELQPYVEQVYEAEMEKMPRNIFRTYGLRIKTKGTTTVKTTRRAMARAPLDLTMDWTENPTEPDL